MGANDMKRRRGDREKAATEFAKKCEQDWCCKHRYDGFIAGAKWADYDPFGVLDEDYAWNVYNFINRWKSGEFGEIPLQKALEQFGEEIEPC
jgi:hypothetical protein